HAVAEAARNVACTGAKPVAATNCLNFGNPEKPPIMGQFSDVIDGMSLACTTLETPITGGNVSFYNETLGEGIYPTPVMGIVGILEDVGNCVGGRFAKPNEAIVLLTPGQLTHEREEEVEFGSSEYALHVLGKMWGLPPYLDLAKEKELQAVLTELAGEKLVTAAKDCAEGGIATALAEMGFAKGAGAKVELISAGLALECVLFGEDASRVVVSCDPAKVARIQKIAGAHGIHAQQIGTTTDGKFEIRVDGESVLSGNIADFCRPWADALEASLKADVELVG
ncbi:MAG TPA: AIR synthase related protein, partial [candidate division Zixibacteria bacterium]|nr:AIR synthase related protein [candidate division Zixibacteria bacterium]